MNERMTKVARITQGAEQVEKLPYRIELWDHEARALDRVLARALTAALAREIFKAVQREHPDRRVLLRRGTRTVADSGVCRAAAGCSDG
ncbi:MAG TPA: hypothetical protein VKW08_22310 [Xanthobacteraceae bacterium]|jgi:hypothetical protein|nr:hypothetical protein [Xanthobacteraceae bacterium]